MIEEWTRKEIQNYILVNQLIRSGTRAQVYKGYSKEDESKLCAIKIIGISSIKMTYVKGEQLALTKLNNPHIMKLYDAVHTDNYLYMFLEYCKDGSLKDYLAKQQQQYLSEFESLSYINQICKGYTSLYKYEIIHHDINPTHILLHQGVAKLTGFKFSINFDQQNFMQLESNYYHKNYYNYTSPQILEGQSFSAKCDIWSVGVIFYEMLYGKTPWTGQTQAEVLENIKTQTILASQISINSCPIRQTQRIDNTYAKNLGRRSYFLGQPFDYQSIKIEVPMMENTLIPEDQTHKKVGQYVIRQKLLGQGAFGNVYSGFLEENQTHQVAVKMIKISCLNSSRLKEMIVKEVNIQKKLNNPHIVKLYDVNRTNNYLYIFLEYCEDGSLKDFLAKKQQQYFSEIEATIIIKQIFEGFKTLNSQNITHRDIRPSNILFHQGIAKITDFGFAREMNEQIKDHKYLSRLRFDAYMAPQLQSFTSKYDVWSVGILYYEMFYGKPSWSAQT